MTKTNTNYAAERDEVQCFMLLLLILNKTPPYFSVKAVSVKAIGRGVLLWEHLPLPLVPEEWVLKTGSSAHLKPFRSVQILVWLSLF